jgi:hypothetical protein
MDVMNFTKGNCKKLVQYLQSKGGIITMEDLGHIVLVENSIDF